MNATMELCALLRRSSQASADRVVFLLHVLDTCVAQGDDGGALSFPSVCLILRYAYPGYAPRFLFALASSGALFRSPDRGVSWRMVCSLTRETAGHAVRSTLPTTQQDAQLADIMQLLPRGHSIEDDPAEPSKAPSLATCLACEGEMVVVGGRRGLLAVSLDRGVHFSWAPARLWDTFTEQGKADAAPVDISHVAVTGPSTLLLVAGPAVAQVNVRAAASGAVSFGGCQKVVLCKTRVCSLTTLLGTGEVRHVCVCESGVLHFSWDAGRHFVAVPHKLGFLRAIAPFRGLRAAHTRVMQSAADFVVNRSSNGSYEYAVVLRKPAAQVLPPTADLCRSRDALRQGGFLEQGPPGQEVLCQAFLATGSGTEVLPYDYSCVLCLGFQLTGNDIAVVSQATNVSYIPFARSTAAEPVPCAVGCIPGSVATVAVRGGSSGVSYSTDGGAVWSVPQKSAPVALLPADGGDIIICSQRGTVTAMRAGTGTMLPATTIAGDFRSPATIVAAAFL